MSTPESFAAAATVPVKAPGNAIEKPLEERERQPRASIAVRGRGELFAGEMRQMSARGVAVKHLGEKDVNGGRGPQKAIAVSMVQVDAQLLDDIRGKGLPDIGLEPSENLSDSGSHPWPPGKRGL
jgi:hypothetical protein